MIGQTIFALLHFGRNRRGGMGVVYEAQDLKLQRTVITVNLKFLTADLALHSRDIARQGKRGARPFAVFTEMNVKRREDLLPLRRAVI